MLKEQLILREVERELYLKSCELDHAAEVASAQYVQQDIYDYHINRAGEFADYHNKLSLPYTDVGTRAEEQLTAASAREMWEAAFGSLDDPETQAKLKRMKEDAERMARERNA